jgi:membrane-associated PAP2 superfamily phosphatase
MEEHVKRDWRADLLVFAALAAILTALFADGRLDRYAATLFYSPDAREHWPLGSELPWSLLYRMAPWITASLVVAALAALALGVGRRSVELRRNAVFVLLSVALGPGLLVNGIFKDHWDRSRPRDIVEFGGELHYSPAPLRGEGGKSFPCGHCSVGFLYAAGWWVWRRRRPALALASVAAGAITGCALGVGRMAAGGHFLSDVAWSALIALGMAHVLYHYVPQRWPRYALPVTAAVGGVAVLAALFAAPHGEQLAQEIAFSSLAEPPQVFEFTARHANVDVVVVDASEPEVAIRGELHGFGLPGSRLGANVEFEKGPLPTLRYRIDERGWFTDLDAAVSIRLPLAFLRRIVVHVERGNIRVSDATRARAIQNGVMQLDLKTGAGGVRIDKS